jgi:hypothetical protein
LLCSGVSFLLSAEIETSKPKIEMVRQA